MQIRRAAFDNYADYVRPGIEAVGAQCGRPGLFAEIEADCAAERAFLFLTDDGGYFVLQPFLRDGAAVVRVLVAVGSGRSSLARYQPLVMQMARDIGGVELEFWTARAGFDRTAPRLGWRKAFTVWSMPL